MEVKVYDYNNDNTIFNTKKWIEYTKVAIERDTPMKPIAMTYKLLVENGWKYACPHCGAKMDEDMISQF